VGIFINVLLYLSINTDTKFTHGISRLAAGDACEQFQVHIKLSILWTQRCSRRPWLSYIGDALGGPDWVNLEIPFEAVIQCVRKCTWRLRVNQLGGCDRACLLIHLEAMIERTGRLWLIMFADTLWGCNGVYFDIQFEAMLDWRMRCTPSLSSSEVGDALGGQDWVNLEMHSKPVIERY